MRLNESMKKPILICLLFLSLIYVHPVLAHVEGISIFKINGLNTKIPPQGYSNPKIPVILEDSDLAPQIYRSGQTLDFQLDLSLFITSKNIFEKTTFIWDFGDGSPKQAITNGSENKHTYTKDGTYLLTIYADYTTAGFKSIPEPQLLQAVVIEVGSEKKVNLNLLLPAMITFSAIFVIAVSMWIFKQRSKGRKNR